MKRSLAALLLLLAGALAGAVSSTPAVATGGGGCWTDGRVEQRVGDVVAEHACWSPVAARVPVGASVNFANNSDMNHNLSGPSLAGDESADLFGFHELKPASSVSITFPAAGVFPYMCSLHPQMAGVVIVGDALSSAKSPAAATVPAAVLTSEDVGTPALSTPAAVGLGGGAVLAASLVVVWRRRSWKPRPTAE